jgi:hypothetical protein
MSSKTLRKRLDDILKTVTKRDPNKVAIDWLRWGQSIKIDGQTLTEEELTQIDQKQSVAEVLRKRWPNASNQVIKFVSGAFHQNLAGHIGMNAISFATAAQHILTSSSTTDDCFRDKKLNIQYQQEWDGSHTVTAHETSTLESYRLMDAT